MVVSLTEELSLRSYKIAKTVNSDPAEKMKQRGTGLVGFPYTGLVKLLGKPGKACLLLLFATTTKAYFYFMEVLAFSLSYKAGRQPFK